MQAKRKSRTGRSSSTTTTLAKKRDTVAPKKLLSDLCALIEEVRQDLARTANAALVLMYWQVGSRIQQDILKQKRAAYGKAIVSALGRELTMEFGRGFSEKSLWHMIRFVEAFPEEKIVSALRRQLSWTHFKQLIYIEDPLKREFYTEMCRMEGWNTRTLGKKIDGMLFERTALSKKPEDVIKHEIKTLRERDKLTPDLVFRDPYFLDFLGLNDHYIEKDLEDAILREMESFILELGIGFTFVARQKRIQVDDDDFYIDLLFYHRKLRRLVAIDLKLGKFKPAYKGQMELYLRWLEEYEQQPEEESPIGLVLCAGKSEEQVKLLRLNEGNVRIGAYMTELPPRPVLKKKLHEALLLARQKQARKQVEPDGDWSGM